MKYDSVVECLDKILRVNYGVKIRKIPTVIKIINYWAHIIGYDLQPFVNMEEFVEEGYVYCQTSAKVLDSKELIDEFGVEYRDYKEIVIVISGDAYGVHPDKELAYLALHESEDDMEYCEWNQDTANEPIGEK